MYEIILFQGEVRAGAGNKFGYPINEKHAFLLFLKQVKNTSPDFEKAKQVMGSNGWRETNLLRAGPVKMESASFSTHPHAASSYKDALATGTAALTFAEPIP